MKRVVVDARNIASSTGRYTENLLRNLPAGNFEFVALVPSMYKPTLPLPEHIKLKASDIRFGSVSEQTLLPIILYLLRADLVHFTMSVKPALYFKKSVTSILDLTATRFGKPSFRRAVYTALVRKSAKTSKHVITISEFVKHDVVKTFNIPLNKITTTYNAADKITDEPEPVIKLKKGSFIMYVGRPQSHKNLSRLIDAFKILNERFTDQKLVLTGKKDKLFLQHEKRVGELGLSDSVVFTDFVSEGQLRWLYENCSAYIFPSLSEGFGLPGLEAMANGAPVVSSRATCLPEIYGYAAYYFDPLNAADMARKISDVLTDEDLRTELVRKGFDQVKRYSWSRMAEQTEGVYQKVLST